nr:MAG TPA: hypothetical protein [Caudoviricetes sp.]
MRRSPVRVWYSRHCEGWGSSPLVSAIRLRCVDSIYV